jgi:hypothetical protein
VRSGSRERELLWAPVRQAPGAIIAPCRTTRTVSKDGKHLLSKSSATSAKGEKTESVQVFDKQ